MKRRPAIIMLILVLASPFAGAPAFALMGASSSYKLDASALTNSGEKGSSLSYTVPVATVGDVSGKGTSSSYKLCVGLAEQRSGACDPVPAPPPPPPPPPPCTYNCGPGPGPIPPDEPTQEPVPPPEPPPTPPEEPTQEPIPQPPEEPTQEPILPPMRPSPGENPPEVPIPAEVAPLPEIMEAPFVEPTSPRALELLTGVWCAENACFDEPIFIVRHAAAQEQEECIPGSSTEITCGLVYVVRPWIIWLTVALLLLVAILSGLYVRAKIKLYEALSKAQRLNARRPVRRKAGTSLNRKRR